VTVRRRLSLAPALLLVAALGCAAASAPRRPLPAAERPRPPAGRSPALDDMMRNDLAAEHAFPWSAARPLAWDDFQGRPPTAGQEGAKTAYILYSIWKCRGDVFEYRVVVAFRPRESWVKPVVLDDSVQRQTILVHEQTHFDLGEVHARRMRRAFADLSGPCRKTNAELGAVADQVGQEEKEEQRRYDAETDHGLFAAEQAAWTQQTRRRLAAGPERAGH